MDVVMEGQFLNIRFKIKKISSQTHKKIILIDYLVHLFYLENRGSDGQPLWHFSYEGQVEEFRVIVVQIEQIDKHRGARGSTLLRLST